jgi:mono/diheme cytochrome c family protein/glucose/arabinose dehydrogenase
MRYIWRCHFNLLLFRRVTRMPVKLSRASFLLLSGVAAMATTMTLMAQTPAPAPPAAQGPAGPPAPAAGPGRAGAPGAPGAPGQAPAAGRGRGANPLEPDFSPKPPVLPLSPAQEQAKFWLPPGFKLEPVLTEPHIEEPAQIAFDGNGRMFVLQLRGYMQDADGGGTLDPTGRISVHEDKDGDGVYEAHSIFVDNLVFPRMVMPFGPNRILTKESNADEVWLYTDTNGDSVADRKELFTTGMGRLANVEHQESHFMWGMDNWIYSTYNAFRVRWTPGGVLREPTGANQAQWGVTQDNYGKPWFQSGASGMPGYFQFPVAYGNFAWQPDQFEQDLNIIWGAPVLIADMQGGMNAVRMPDGSLARATGAAGNDVFRGDRLPADMIGDYFYGETVGRVVRRLRPVKIEGMTQLRNVYPLSEFIRSTDPLFRPVDMTTAPDGTMYITDMYRGIIQESQWSGPGTYLRQKIDQYALDKVVRHGRIWRLSYEGMGRRTELPRMNDETPAQLVAHLSHTNGWWRDTAQQLLVLKQDKSVVPALAQLARSSSNQLARIHALWTLEGLGSADAALVRELMKSPDPQIRMAAVRVSETLYKAGDRSFAADYANLTKDADVDVVLQAILTLNTLKVANAPATIKAAMDANPARGVRFVADRILNPPAAAGRGGGGGAAAAATMTEAETAAFERGQTIYNELCFSCHGDDGRGAEREGSATAGAPPLAGSARVTGHRDHVIKVLLHGMTGPINGTSYLDVMIPMGMQNDEWIASVGSYVRNAFGNRAPFITADDVARVRAATKGRTTSWTLEELNASIPRQVVFDSSWKFNASHNPRIAQYAVTIQPWTSGAPQAPGMWLQVELPQPVMLTEVQFETSPVVPVEGEIVPGAPPRSGGGRGAAAGAAPQLGFPRGYKVEVSTDGTNWGQPVAQGAGSGVVTTASFAPVRAKFVRITQTAPATPGAPPFAVQRLRLYEAGGAR